MKFGKGHGTVHFVGGPQSWWICIPFDSLLTWAEAK